MASKSDGSNQIKFVYKKTGNYRTYFADGVHGGISPRGYLHLDIFVEKQATPESELYSMRNQTLHREDFDPKSNHFVREVEASIVMDYNLMVSLRNWLNSKIDEFEKKFGVAKGKTQ